MPGDRCRPAVRPEERRQDSHRRRLARAVGAEQREHAAACHVEVDPGEHKPVCVELCRPVARTAGPSPIAPVSSWWVIAYDVLTTAYAINRYATDVKSEVRTSAVPGPIRDRRRVGRDRARAPRSATGVDRRAGGRGRRRGGRPRRPRRRLDARRRRPARDWGDVALPLRREQGRAARADDRRRHRGAGRRPRRRRLARGPRAVGVGGAAAPTAATRGGCGSRSPARRGRPTRSVGSRTRWPPCTKRR